MKKPRSQGMRVRVYQVLDRAVEDGVNAGWRRAHKHAERAGEDAIKEAIHAAVLAEICDWFAFDDEEQKS